MLKSKLSFLIGQLPVSAEQHGKFDTLALQRRCNRVSLATGHHDYRLLWRGAVHGKFDDEPDAHQAVQLAQMGGRRYLDHRGVAIIVAAYTFATTAAR